MSTEQAVAAKASVHMSTCITFARRKKRRPFWQSIRCSIHALKMTFTSALPNPSSGTPPCCEKQPVIVSSVCSSDSVRMSTDTTFLPAARARFAAMSVVH